jgi:hypothetical protein
MEFFFINLSLVLKKGLATGVRKNATEVRVCVCVGYLDLCRPVLVLYVDELRSCRVKK